MEEKAQAWSSLGTLERAASYRAYGIEMSQYTDYYESSISGDSLSKSRSTDKSSGDRPRIRVTETDDDNDDAADGTMRLFGADGKMKLIPMPTGDPKDPLNWSTKRKILAIGSLCIFAGFAVSSEAIIGALVPIFVLYYAGLNPHVLDNLKFKPGTNVGLNPLSGLEHLSPYPLWEIYLIASLPVLVIGLSHYLLIPSAIAFGRRPVVLATGFMAVAGGIGAGFTTTLGAHLGCRCLQGIGIGTVESLLPLIMQDIVFIDYRSRAISAIWCSQGIIIVGFGMFSPMIIAATSWQWIYWMTGAAASVAYIGIIFLTPETRYYRSALELKGVPAEPLDPGLDRPKIDYHRYSPITLKTKLGFQADVWWNASWQTLKATFISMLFPPILFISILNTCFVAVVLAAGQAGAPVLLSYGWPFKYLGFAVGAIVAAAIFVGIVGGWGSDKFANWVTKRFYNGVREPEVHFWNMIIPMFSSCLGCALFGVAGSFTEDVSWWAEVMGIFFLAFGLLVVNVVGSVYVVEAYPEWAGPVLINVASFRNVVGFAMFGMWAGVMFGISAVGLPLMILYGKRMRAYTQKYIAVMGPVGF